MGSVTVAVGAAAVDIVGQKRSTASKVLHPVSPCSQGFLLRRLSYAVRGIDARINDISADSLAGAVIVGVSGAARVGVGDAGDAPGSTRLGHGGAGSDDGILLNVLDLRIVSINIQRHLYGLTHVRVIPKSLNLLVAEADGEAFKRIAVGKVGLLLGFGDGVRDGRELDAVGQLDDELALDEIGITRLQKGSGRGTLGRGGQGQRQESDKSRNEHSD